MAGETPRRGRRPRRRARAGARDRGRDRVDRESRRLSRAPTGGGRARRVADRALRRDRRRAASRLGDVDDAAGLAGDRDDRRRRRLAPGDFRATVRAAVPVAHSRRGRGAPVRACVFPRAPAFPHAQAPRRPDPDRALFERRVEIVADIGYDGRIAAAEWGSVIPPMLPLLREGRAGRRAHRAGSSALDALLASRGYVGDRPRRERAARRDDARGRRATDEQRCASRGAPLPVALAALMLAPLPALAADVPFLTGRVVDNAEILTPATRASG